jgi:chaperonin GroES
VTARRWITARPVPLAVKVGDTVVFGQYAGSNTIEVDGEELIIMGESEIYAVVE